MTFHYLPNSRLNIIVGNFGSGKTEVSVHLAIHTAKEHRVQIVDLDIVNPYFRCREAVEEMEAQGIRVVFPKGDFHAADLPIILPEIKGTVAAVEEYVFFDVGGDDMGARVLSSLADLISHRDYAMLQVINASRPFTSDAAGCLKMKGEIEAASRLKVTGVIANTHLMDQTDADTVRKGLDVARAVATREDLTLEFATVPPGLEKELTEKEAGCPLLTIDRRMLPPWRLGSMTDKAGRILNKDAEPHN